MKKRIVYAAIIFILVFGFQLFVSANDLTGTDDQGASAIEEQVGTVEPMIPGPFDEYLDDTTETVFFALQTFIGVVIGAIAIEKLVKSEE